MYLFAKSGDHTSYRNEVINFYINPYMDTLEKSELTASILRIAIFSKSGIPIYNSEVLDTAGRKKKKEKKKKKKSNTGNCRALCVPRKRNERLIGFLPYRTLCFFPVFIRF